MHYHKAKKQVDFMSDGLNGQSRIGINPQWDFRDVACALDIPSARYTFAFLIKGKICQNEKDLSHIKLTRSGNISSSSKTRRYLIHLA